jgi:hypothetical protein
MSKLPPKNCSRPSPPSEADAPKRRPEDATYEIGYAKPPVATRFKPGQSGNPKGRRVAERRDFRQILMASLEQTVTIVEEGRRRSVTKFEAAFMQIQNQAAKGHLPSIKLLFAVAQLLFGKEFPPAKKMVKLIIEGS